MDNTLIPDNAAGPRAIRSATVGSWVELTVAGLPMDSTGRPVSSEAYRAFRAKQVMTRRVRRGEEPRNVSPGREITDEINADTEGAERLREARRQVHDGAVRWADTDPADTA